MLKKNVSRIRFWGRFYIIIMCIDGVFLFFSTEKSLFQFGIRNSEVGTFRSGLASFELAVKQTDLFATNVAHSVKVVRLEQICL